MIGHFFMNTIRFTNLPGDGIGPEVISIALQVLEKTGEKFGFKVKPRCAMPVALELIIMEVRFLNPHSLLSVSRRHPLRLRRRPKMGKPSTNEQPERAALHPFARV